MRVAIIFNQPTLDAADPDAASEQGVLEARDALRAALTAESWIDDVACLPVSGNTAELVAALSAARPDAVINLCEGLHGRGEGESQIAGLVELMGLPLAGTTSQGLALARDKVRTKLLLCGAGLSTPDFVWVPRDAQPDENELSQLLAAGAVIVKPADEDASLGIGPDSVTDDLDHALRLVADVAERYGAVLVERFIAGRELNVSVVALDEPRVLPLAEIEFDGSLAARERVVSYDAKWAAASSACLLTPAKCPADVDEPLASELRSMALQAFQIVGCRHFARIDMRIDEHGRPYILEVNANCDLGPSAGFARAWTAAGKSYDELAMELVRCTVRSSHDRPNPSPPAPLPQGARGGQAESQASLKGQGPAHRRRHKPALEMRNLLKDDLPALLDILRECGVFRPPEIAVGEEVLRDALAEGPDCDYRVTVATADRRPVGWACHGLVPLTDGTYDLYWIAVAPEQQGAGVGRALVEQVERLLAPQGARWLIAETSSAPLYQSTRTFYERCGFVMLSDIPDFYRRGDGRTVYGKRLG